MEEEDKHLLIRVNEQLGELIQRVVLSNPAAWVYLFERILAENKKFTSDKEAQYFADKGRRAIEMSDVEELKRSTRGLMLLLPPEERELIQGTMPGITY